MDLLPSGNRQVELVVIETSKIYLTIKGKFNTNNIKCVEREYCDSFDCYCINPEDLIHCSTYSHKPLFYEYQDYEVIIEDKGTHDIRFYHESKIIRDQITYTTKSKKVLSGLINFNGDIGLSEFIIYVNNKEHLVIKLEVFPKKIDYKTDYFDMLADVNSEIHNLSFEFLRRTYFNMTLSSKQGNSLAEFYSILNYIYLKLINSIKIIISQPHHQLMEEREIVPHYKLKRANKQTINWLRRKPMHLVKKNDKLIPFKALQINKIVTVDTYENQFLKYMLENIICKLEELKLKYIKLNRTSDELLIEKIDNMIKEINSNIKGSFLSKVSRFKPKDSFSLVLKMAPGYKEMYKYYLMLKKGLSLYGDVFRLSMKDLALLYEYWCFIKINSILKKKYNLIQNNLIKINTNGVFVTLKKGRTTEVTYQNPKNGEIFTISYNLKMDSETIPQKPDNVFRITKKGSEITYNFIFDAKYRLDTLGKNSNGIPGPEEEDINTMHRYRDAIILENDRDVERNIFGAFVLFPYHSEEEYKNHRFYKSISRVNIGGIPFLPNSTKIMEEFLDELIEESFLSSYERSLKQHGYDKHLKEKYFKERTVLLGSLSSKKQLQVNLKHNFYHTKLRNVDLDKHLIKTIALVQSNNLFNENAGIKYFGNVRSIKIVKRSEITEIPKDSDELYIRFEIDGWQELDNPIQVREFGVRTIMYTTDFLLYNAETISELCIKTEEEFRIWMELKRLVKENLTLEQDSKSMELNGFRIGDTIIYTKNNKLEIVRDGRIKDIYINEFKKRPRSIIKKILKEI